MSEVEAMDDLRPPGPVIVLDLFPEERAALLALLASLTPEQWDAPTACAGWSVKDIAAHLLADDLGRLSRGRDGYRGHGPRPDEPLLTFIDRQNAEWVIAARRLSPRVLIDLLDHTGAETQAYFAALDPFALGGPVNWAGPEPAPIWLDLAREYTERWHHQQHIRDAVGAPSLTTPRLFAPVLATFVRALPVTFRSVAAPGRTVVALRIAGESGGDWAVVGERADWSLFAGDPPVPDTRVTLDQETAWRLFTKGITSEAAERRARIEGDQALGQILLQTVAIIA